ncbi:MAG: ABC transporter substrate-binding protein [Acholeplasma sp.]|nr:ABC transporter substrate-binding protein [Acholeplasma sp.]
MKKIFVVLMLLISLTGLVGCQIVNDDKTYDETVTIEQSVTKASNRNDENATVETVNEVIPTNPKKVAIFDFGVLDIFDFIGLEALAIEQIAIVKSNLPGYLSKYNTDAVTNAGTLFEPSFDTLDLFNPDLVIISSRSSWSYNTLKTELGGVAVLNVTIDNQNYLDSLKTNLEHLKLIFNNNEVFDTMYETLESKTNIIKEQAIGSGFKSLILMTNGDDISGYGIGSRFGFIHNELSFSAADEHFGNADANTHGDTVSFEYVQNLNPDVIFVVDRAQAIGGEPSIGVLDNALIDSTNAAKNNRIILLDSVSWYIVSGGYQSTLKMIEDTQTLFS